MEENSKLEYVSLGEKKITSLLYADDLVLFAEKATHLQNKLNLLEDYCKKWCLNVNINKTKIIIFNKNGKLLNENFHLGSCNLECVKNYKYLGIIISASGKFTEAKTQLHNKALKATFKLYKDLKTTEPSVSTLLHLFDHMIKPIVLYGCEIWGTLTNATLQTTTDIYDLFKDWEFEKLNIKFCKYILGVNRRSTNIAILSELGKYPLHISLLVSIFSFWHRLQNKEDNSLLSNALKESIYLNNSGVNSWISSITFLSQKLGIHITKK